MPERSFACAYTDDEITTNLSLQEKLKVEFGLNLPDVPDDDLSPSDYFQQVTAAVQSQPGWEVLENDIILWFYTFTKFLMFRDLQPENWPDERPLQEHGLVGKLLGEGMTPEPPTTYGPLELDEALPPLEMIHVVDADSSQAIVIDEVRRGTNLVIQGPPGTGKSQTITNLIAAAVKDGRKVLFVAEKMAALEVVKRRLDSIELGAACLELHSNKANKRVVLGELARTLELGPPKLADVEGHAKQLAAHRARLNRHATLMHAPIEASGLTPFRAIGELVKLQADGVPATQFQLPGTITWTADEVRTHQGELEDLALHAARVGNPAEHPWRGVRLDAVLPTDAERIQANLPALLEPVDRLIWATNTLAEILEQQPATPLDAANLANLARRLARAPQMDRQAMTSDVWRDRRSDIDRLLVEGQRLAAAREQLDGVFVDAAWTTEVQPVRCDLAAYGRSFFRFLRSGYRHAATQFRGILVDAPPKDIDACLKLLDDLIEGQQADRFFDDTPDTDELGRNAFGTFWQGKQSDWPSLTAIAKWEAKCREENSPRNFRAAHARISQPKQILTLFAEIKTELKPTLEAIKRLFNELSLDLAERFGENDLRQIPLRTLRDHLASWHACPEELSKWTAYHARKQRVSRIGIDPLIDHLADGRIPAGEITARFRKAYCEQLIRHASTRHPELAEFEGDSHEKVLKTFRRLDLERMDLACAEVAHAHHRGLPTTQGEVGEIGVVRREVKKKRRHLPLRKLLTEAGHAVQAIKPVFMMSPISVAQFLAPGILEFDLLLIDEASQVQPVDALGAIARARQIVVVGDERQLPPTSFFNTVVGDTEDDEDTDVFQAADLESILGLCESQGMTRRMLEWHYRSRHPSLIAVSNHEFYEDRLFVVPSPFSKMPALGVKFHLVTDGLFERGRSRTNRGEARAIVDAVMEHAVEYPDKTLGVGAFSVAQRDAILDELELRRRQHPELESFFIETAAEPFFVKNLENIQGDERDVILISVGYGPDESGHMTMNFGPLNSDGGERRLNVLISRAKERCEIFASFTSDRLDLRRSNSRGVAALKTYLHYAETGNLDVLGVSTDREPDSDFELQVARAIENHGYVVEHQVGVAGFFVDLAIVDPDTPGRYLLGIECDGETYHSSRWARDRDRLREQVLVDRQWLIHRIWSTDWFRRPQGEIKKVLAAAEQAKREWSARDRGRTTPLPKLRKTANRPSSPGAGPKPKPNPTSSPSASSSIDTSANANPNIASNPTSSADLPAIEREPPSADPDQQPPEAKTDWYIVTQLKIPAQARGKQLHEVPVDRLASVLAEVVKTEGPIHRDEIVRRVTDLWGLKRTGKRIARAVDAALDHVVQSGHVTLDGDFALDGKCREIRVRNRSRVESSTLRRVEYLPGIEIREALSRVIAEHHGISPEDAIGEAAKMLGITRKTAAFRERTEQQLQHLLDTATAEHRNGRLYNTAGPMR